MGENEKFAPSRVAVPVDPNKAIPSRAEAKVPPPEPPITMEDVAKMTAAHPLIKKAKKLAANEIKALNAKRAKALKEKTVRKQMLTAKRAKALGYTRPKTDRHAVAAPAKNPNRPLELRNTLDAVLHMTGTLKRPELVAFSSAMQSFRKLSKAGRRRVIASLAQVYP